MINQKVTCLANIFTLAMVAFIVLTVYRKQSQKENVKNAPRMFYRKCGDDLVELYDLAEENPLFTGLCNPAYRVYSAEKIFVTSITSIESNSSLNSTSCNEKKVVLGENLNYYFPIYYYSNKELALSDGIIQVSPSAITDIKDTMYMWGLGYKKELRIKAPNGKTLNPHVQYRLKPSLNNFTTIRRFTRNDTVYFYKGTYDCRYLDFFPKMRFEYYTKQIEMTDAPDYSKCYCNEYSRVKCTIEDEAACILFQKKHTGYRIDPKLELHVVKFNENFTSGNKNEVFYDSEYGVSPAKRTSTNDANSFFAKERQILTNKTSIFQYNNSAYTDKCLNEMNKFYNTGYTDHDDMSYTNFCPMFNLKN